ncbi:MAG: biotin/lipoyl-containing protein [Acidobacteriota bacterium]
MKFEIVIGGQAASLTTTGERFEYRREGGPAMERQYSAASAGDGTLSILIDGRSYAVAILGAGEVSVNGRVFRVDVFDPREQRGRRAAAENSGPQAMTAPMPGRVIRVLVVAGQEVAAGEGLIVVEAMKMQNEMKSPRAGRVQAIKTAAGAAVSAGDVLLVIE